MNVLLAILASISVCSAEVENLGVITPRTAVILDKNTERPDFLKFKVKLNSLPPSSNHVVLIVTNALLTVDTLSAVPSGGVLMEVSSIFMDGQESEPVFYRFSLWRGVPPSPTARTTAISDKPSKNEVVVGRGIIVNSRGFEITSHPPLPSGSSETYAEKSDRSAEEMIRHYRKSGRRSQ